MLALRRSPLEWLVRLAIPVTVLDIALGSNWSPSVRAIAGPLRWPFVAGFGLLALAYGLRERALRLQPVVAGLTVGLVALALVSTLWSVDPRLTLARAVAFGTLLVATAALASGSAGDGEAVRGFLVAVLAGAVVVALVGLAVWLINPNAALQKPTASLPVRYRGLGQNPNTVSMLLAVALPIALCTFLLAERRIERAAAAGAALLLAGSIVASGSRGALLAAFAGGLVVALTAARDRRARLLATGAAFAALAVGIGITRIPKPLPPTDPRFHAVTAPGSQGKRTPHNADWTLRLQDEIGRPREGDRRGSSRNVLGLSARSEAWGGGLRQARDRPFAGYGFGSEDKVFVDRYYGFDGGVTENSYIGALLQLGVAGLVLLVGLLVSLAAVAARAFRRAELHLRLVVATCAAVLLVGIGLAVVQSYLYSVGNTATLSMWLCAFLVLAAAAQRPGTA